MTITIKPADANCGAEIFGIDARAPLSPADADALYQAFLEHQVIFLRNQELSPADQKRFAGYFGEIGAYNRPKERQHPKYASDEIMLISNVREDGQVIGAHPDGEMMWHTDTPYLENPHKATTLYGVEVPESGADTLFSNQYAVFDALPKRIKTRLAGVMAMNAYEFGTTVKTFDRYDREAVPHFAHPVFRRHPESGRVAVYVCPLMTEEIIGIPEEEGRALLEEIYEVQRQTKFIYRHQWQVGDLIIWDNRCLVHARSDFSPDQRRLLRRVTVSDEVDVMAA